MRPDFSSFKLGTITKIAAKSAFAASGYSDIKLL